VMRMSELLRRESKRSFIVLQIAAGVSLLPMILHSMFDFAIHIPANAMWFAAPTSLYLPFDFMAAMMPSSGTLQ